MSSIDHPATPEMTTTTLPAVLDVGTAITAPGDTPVDPQQQQLREVATTLLAIWKALHPDSPFSVVSAPYLCGAMCALVDLSDEDWQKYIPLFREAAAAAEESA